jgi:hypothetical protein
VNRFYAVLCPQNRFSGNEKKNAAGIFKKIRIDDESCGQMGFWGWSVRQKVEVVTIWA